MNQKAEELNLLIKNKSSEEIKNTALELENNTYKKEKEKLVKDINELKNKIKLIENENNKLVLINKEERNKFENKLNENTSTINELNNKIIEKDEQFKSMEDKIITEKKEYNKKTTKDAKNFDKNNLEIFKVKTKKEKNERRIR